MTLYTAYVDKCRKGPLTAIKENCCILTCLKLTVKATENLQLQQNLPLPLGLTPLRVLGCSIFDTKPKSDMIRFSTCCKIYLFTYKYAIYWMNDKAGAILAGVSLTPVFRLQLFVMVCFLMPGVSMALVVLTLIFPRNIPSSVPTWIHSVCGEEIREHYKASGVGAEGRMILRDSQDKLNRTKYKICVYKAPFLEERMVTLSNPVEKVAYLTIFHILFVLFVWTYWKSIFTPPVQPGKKYHMSYADKERYENEERPEVQRQILSEMARKLPVYTRTGNGGIRFCDRCQLIKPDRCHHCSVCAVCVLKMDHHCPWVNNCIGFSNYKFFLLFLAYSLLYCLYIAATVTVFKYFINYWTGELTNGRSKFHVLFLLFVAIMFFVSLMFLFGYHCWLVSRNRSTLEAFSAPVFQNGPDKNGFNLGFVKNLQQVFGEEKKLWLLPIASSQGDGHFFPMRALCEARNPLLANEEQWEDDGIDEEPHDSGEASSLAIERET
ncbi:PREDICTED: LOW QUALITY PROTEIN: palmitoyltransferase ZDHHC15 [Charadrius vociferus]|uniref:LOW QUALITY PROTEIN: palmitoyltransferase ZDHHC15 n=1 Tax=Charadrius vociferus TaxID=50402 RepID=UPI00052125AC|nr:PREDICTED: LOW QUALITY PROTEIN: palmitoyltransferase ZDHHC15 [Charadrius vociferus]